MNQQTGPDGPEPEYLALPPGGSGPGVVVLHAWWGLNDFFRRFCDRLAAEGFVVAAPDMYGGALAATPEEAEKLAQTVDSRQAQAQVRDAFAYLKAHPAVRGQGLGVIGFSMGGSYALWATAALPKDVRAAVTFYGAGEADFSQARAAILGHFSAIDPWEPLEYVQALEESLRQAGSRYTFHFYEPAGHWFMEDNRPRDYDPVAAGLAWSRTLEFLRQHLDGA